MTHINTMPENRPTDNGSVITYRPLDTNISEDLHIKCIQSYHELQSMRNEWNTLLHRSSMESIFLTWEWITTWWEFFKEERNLYILAVRDATNQLQGIAPFMIERPRNRKHLRTVEFIGAGEEVSPDYLNIIASPNMETEVTRQIFRYLWEQQDMWDLIYLSDVLEDTTLLQVVQDMASTDGLTYNLEPLFVCPYIPLPDSWDTLFGTLKGKKRYEMRRRWKLLQKEHQVQFFRCEDRDSLDKGLESFFKLHAKRWGEREMEGMFEAHPNIPDFHRSVATKCLDNNWLGLFLMEVDGEPVASLYGFEYAQKLFHYNSGFDSQWAKHGVAKQLIALVIEHAIQRGLKEFDFLKGDEAYKYEWTKLERHSMQLTIWNQSMKSHLYRVADNTIFTLKRHLLKR